MQSFVLMSEYVGSKRRPLAGLFKDFEKAYKKSLGKLRKIEGNIDCNLSEIYFKSLSRKENGNSAYWFVFSFCATF